MAKISAAKFTDRDILVTGKDPSTGEYLSAAQRKSLFKKTKISSNQIFRKPGAIVKVESITPAKKESAIVPTDKKIAAKPGIDLTILSVRVTTLEKQVSFLAKALDREAELEKKQQKEKEKKLLQQEESGRRSAKEKQLEKSLSDKLLSPVKAIGGVAKGLLGGLMELFGTLFAGWLTDKGWKALKALAEGNTDELNKIAGNVGKTLLVIGGIFLALNGGIGVVLGLIPGIIGGLLSVSALLLNPLTWKAILLAGTVAAGAQAFEAAKENLDPGQRSRERVLKTLGIDETMFSEGKGQTARDYGLKPTQKYETTNYGLSKFYQIGDKFYVKSEIDRFLSSKGEFGDVSVYVKTQIKSFNKLQDRMKFVGKEKVDLKSLQEGKAFTGAGADKFRQELINQRTKIRVGAAYKEYYKSNEDLYRQQERIKDKKKLLATATDPRTKKALQKEIADLESKIPAMVNNKKFALSKVGEFYEFLSPADKEKLKSELGIEKDKLVPGLLNTGQLQYTTQQQLNKFVAPIQEKVAEAQKSLEASTSVAPAAPAATVTPPATPAIPATPAATVTPPAVTKQAPGPVTKTGSTQVVYKRVASGGGAQMQQPLKIGSASDVPLISSSNPNNFYTMYSQMVYNVVI